MNSNLSTFVLSCKREHVFSDKLYLVYITESELVLTEKTLCNAKYHIPLNLQSTIYWNFNQTTKSTKVEFGISYKKNIKFFKAELLDLLKLKHMLANKVVFSYITNPYKIGNKVGQGSHCTVYEAKNTLTGEQQALKMSKSGVDVQEGVLREVAIMRDLIHTNIVQQNEVICDVDRYIVVQEMMNGRTLKQAIKDQGAIGKNQTRVLIKQLLTGLHTIHSKGYLHRDLKPENLMFSDVEENNLKIIDFGYAGRQNEEVDYIFGTYGYFAPECINQTEQQNSKSDIYSVGCIFYEMLTGHKLFGGSTTSMIKYHNEQGNMDLSSSKINALERDLLSKMLSSSTADRLSAKQALQHAYFGTDISSPTNNEVTRADLDVCSPRIQKVGVITDDSIVFVKDSPVCKNGPQRDLFTFRVRKQQA